MSNEYECLEDFATSARQKEIYQCLIDGMLPCEIPEEIGMDRSHMYRSLRTMKERAAKAGRAPGHWNKGVAPGYRMGKVTVQRDASGDVERTWERQHPDEEAYQDIIEAMTERAEGIKPLGGIGQNTITLNDDLVTVYTITDLHLGMLCWGKETGQPWDIRISTEVLRNALSDMIGASPNSGKAVVVLLGDFVHWDGVNAVTPTAHNLLDSDIRFPKLQFAALEAVEYCLTEAAKKHREVTLVQSEGNHDLASSSWLRIVMHRLFQDSERVSVDIAPMPYHAMLHGKVFLGWHHGHRKRGKVLPGIFASEPRFREMWGQALFTYIHTGHLHSSEKLLDEVGGAIVERHPTLAARDAYATGLGATAIRGARAITYHKDRGEIHRVTVSPRYEEE